MAITVHEFDTVTAAGEPVFPPTKSTAATGTPFKLDPQTKYVVVSSSAAGTLAVANTSQAAGAAWFQLEAGRNFGFTVKPNNANIWVDGV